MTGIAKLLANIQSDLWRDLLIDWERFLRAANHPESTRYGYVLAACQLAAYLVDELPGSGPALDPRLVTRRQVVAFQAWMIETRSPATAVNKYKSLQQFFRWLLQEEEIERSPIEGVPLPNVGQKLIPVISDAETQEILGVCRGNSFLQLRDQALVRMYYNTGARLSEIGCLLVADLDLDTNSVVLHGKGDKERRVRFGSRTARILTRYLRARNRRDGIAEVKELWIADRGTRPLKSSGIKIRLKRIGEKAGLSGVYAHRWRHSFAHEWRLAGGDTGDLMMVLGWSSEEMARRYGANAAAERAQRTQARLGIGERV
ncbi:tyrosine recombinase XerD [Paractinoplanes tereljensis]|uniref:Tyrosine recombinase XerD n=2 Tax=Paractinoplanes tereljensis TaxID=571912 RepID=A0A919NRM1_9ACTN|nr:tyrosine recombinase XerD [Actinoplanes tereljensis]